MAGSMESAMFVDQLVDIYLGGGNSYIFLCSPRTLGKMNPVWRSYFSDGVKPPIRYYICHYMSSFRFTERWMSFFTFPPHQFIITVSWEVFHWKKQVSESNTNPTCPHGSTLPTRSQTLGSYHPPQSNTKGFSGTYFGTADLVTLFSAVGWGKGELLHSYSSGRWVLLVTLVNGRKSMG